MTDRREEFRPIITKWARQYFLEADLVMAMCDVESSFQPLSARFEPGYRYLFSPDVFARKLVQSLDTEKTQQMMSWGLMHIMGGTARECGYIDYLPGLGADPELGLQFGCIYLYKLRNRYPLGMDAVAAYNAGSPRKDATGRYVNQGYVDKVIAALARETGTRAVIP